LIPLAWITIMDARERRIPNAALALGLAIWLGALIYFSCFRAIFPTEILLKLVLPAVIVMAILMAIESFGRASQSGGAGMGAGDIKLIGLIYLYLSLTPTLMVVALACIAAIMWVIATKKLPAGSDNLPLTPETELGIETPAGTTTSAPATSASETITRTAQSPTQDFLAQTFPFGPFLSVTCALFLLSKFAFFLGM